MIEKRVGFNNIVRNQLPEYVREEFPLISEFLTQYYISQEYQGAPVDLIQNIDKYVKVDEISETIESVILKSDIDFEEETIEIDLEKSPSGTKGFPKSYGLIKIDDEIITYTGITSTSFVGCIRGFSGIDSYKLSNSPDILSFKTSNSSSHKSASIIVNLSSLFLREFLNKTKYQLLPGFESREIYNPIKESLFIKQAKDFYSSKGSDNSFKILFNALYGKDVTVLKPKDNLIKPSDANYEVTNDFVVEAIEGNPLNLIDSTLRQDEYQNYTKAYAPITNVQKIQTKTGENYYKLSIDSGYSRDIIVDGSTYGDFSVHPKTKAIEEHVTGSTEISVDSTIGFSDSGELYVEYEDNTFGSVSYTSKSINQFYGCSNVTKKILDNSIITVNTFAYGSSIENESEIIKVRIASVIDDIILEDSRQNFYHIPNTELSIKTLGIDASDYISNNWLFNISPSYNNISFQEISNNGTNYVYRIKTKSPNIFESGDFAEFTSNISSEKFDASIIQKNNIDLITVQLDRQLLNNSSYIIRRKLSKTKSPKYPDLSNVICNVQNTYKQGESTFVASNSLPSYTIETDDLSVSGQFIVLDDYTFECEKEHPFSNGDIVYYKPNSSSVKLTSEGIYHVKKVSNTRLKFSKGNSNLSQSNFVHLESTSNGKIEFYHLKSKSLKPQNLLRNISSPINDGFTYPSVPGKIGILKNGVEILNYKSKDRVLYGTIESVDVLSPGNDYDVINPPNLVIEDSHGTGAKGYCSVEGSLRDIRVLDAGFDYVEIPQIKISGGNGSGAVAVPNIKFVDHVVDFNSESQVTLGSTITSKIGFSTYHKFRDGEKVFYKSNGFTNIGGLISNSSYYIKIISPTEIKLHKSLEDVIAGVAVSFTSYGTGKHSIKSSIRKTILGTISILNSGSGYQNKKRTVQPTGINTSLGIISIKNHGFKSGEIVRYKTEGTTISGLTDNKDYILTSIDENSFLLSEVGTGSTNTNFYFNTKNYVRLNSPGIGTHTFNYPPISVEIIGKIGVSTIGGLSEDTFKAKILADFKGGITSIHLSDNGVGYGSSDIINFDRQPSITTFSGSGAVLKPIVNEGKIVDVLIISGGGNYISTPILSVVGDGSGAILIPIVKDKKIISVKIIEPGFGYNQNNVSISIKENGSGVRFYTRLQNWNINLVERFKKYFKTDDGFITNSLDDKNELQYTHLYCPRNLIEIESSNKHSPIIGWAYDGNPIYGPYAYSSKDGISNITRMKSGYGLISSNDQNKNRPSSSIFPLGFFIEDYEYLYNNNSEFLDENNGRFCITPEFPLGTYAYFSTLDIAGSDSFSEYRNPVFPYFVGNTYKSKPNDLNFSTFSNQSSDLNFIGLTRNTSPYGLVEENTKYTYLNNQNYKLKPAEIRSVSPGIVEDIQVIFGGDKYKVNDKLTFDNEGTRGFGAYAKVAEVEGKNVQTISVATTSINNVEFYANSLDKSIIGISRHPHSLKDQDLVSIVGVNSSFILDSYRIGVSTNSLVLTKSVTSSSITGLITYFSVYGGLNLLSENDVLKIESEKVKILEIDKISSRIKVLREIDGTVGSSHSASTSIQEDPRRFVFRNDNYFTLPQNRNKEIYFNPTESLGIGTQFGIGIGKTLVFSNPGAGITQIFIPSRTIYLPDHQLETGDELIYNIESGGTSILVSTNGTENFTLPDKSKLYVAKISSDLIGISTVRVGLGTTGSFVGVTTQTNTSGILYLVGVGIGSNHSFKTNYNITTGKVIKNTTTVVLDEDPKLNKGDSVFISVNPSISTSISIKYNDYNKRLITNTLNFSSSGINTINGTIQIINHNLVSGQKVVYSSNNPPEKLENNGIYFVSLVDENTIKLSDSFYNSTLQPPVTLGLSTASNGSISLINPPIRLYKDSTVIFDLSDSSLSYTQSGINYSAFDFNIYKDSDFTEVFDKLDSSTTFDVQKIGSVGIDASARLVLNVKEDFPQKLYYKLTPITKNETLPNSKKEIVTDFTVFSNNTLEILDSFYNGRYFVSSSSTNSFTYFAENKPEFVSYSSSSSTIKYTTDSLTASGPISRVQITNGGRNYFELPKISKINSTLGSNAILEPSSQSIGKIKKVNIKDLGFDFSADYTLKPSCYSLLNVTVDPLYRFESIGITSYGIGYNTPPKLIVIDNRTQEIIDDLDLEFSLDKNQVTILKNTFKLSEIPPKIIPIQNTNGVGINSISYDPSNKRVTVTLSREFDNLDDFPFFVGDKVLIENVYIEGEGVGYNSKNYNYSLFELIEVYGNIGIGFAEIVYSLENFLENNQTPGEYSNLNSFGRVILEKHFPSFSSKLKRGEYLIGERLISNSIDCGKVSYWNPLNGLLLITESNIELISGQQIKGVSSNATSNIKKVFQTDLSCNLGPKSNIVKGWKKNIGFLNEDTQKIQDSFYYQNFSYSLKSEISYDTWSDAVLTLNHPRGFKVFADYQLESENYIGISTQIDESNIDVVVDIVSVTDTNTYYNFGTAKETNVEIDSNLISNEIIFDNKILSDYILSIGNRVISIDDISSQFDNANASRKDFNLTSNNDDIFKRIFDGSNQNIVDINSDTIRIQNHFFVTGEKLFYSNGSNSSLNSIGIGTTDFGVGIGITDKLPEYVYAVKIDDSKIKLARSAEDSLSSTPKTLDFISVGIGSSHYFSSTNQNSRVLVAIDNIIQSPIVSTAITTQVLQNITGTSSTVYFSNAESFFSGDLVKINNEIMKVYGVGIGSTNSLNVNRAWMGTNASSHLAGDVAIKIIGDYNIIENTINFSDSPYGETLKETAVEASATTADPSFSYSVSERFDSTIITFDHTGRTFDMDF